MQISEQLKETLQGAIGISINGAMSYNDLIRSEFPHASENDRKRVILATIHSMCAEIASGLTRDTASEDYKRVEDSYLDQPDGFDIADQITAYMAFATDQDLIDDLKLINGDGV